MKKLKQIEFNAELIGKEGIEIKCRNKKKPLQVCYFKQLTDPYSVLALVSEDYLTTFTIKGEHVQGEVKDYDLIMYKEVEEITLHVVKCDDANFFGIAYLKLEDAVKHVGGRNIDIIEFKEVSKDEL